MALIAWKDIYLTNIKECDDQHKKLVDLINQLHEKMKEGTTKQFLEELLSELLDYTAYHFLTEESLFETYSYPDAKQHIKQHQECTEKIKEFSEAFNNSDTYISIKLSKFLKEWLITHTLDSDQKYGPFLTKAIKE
jgi:hemerythrin